MNSVNPRHATMILRRLAKLSIPLFTLVLFVGWAVVGSGGCVGTGGGSGNDNDNMNNENMNGGNANDNSDNDNSSNDNSDNGNSDNDNTNGNSNDNANTNDNGNDNDNSGDNSNSNENDNSGDNSNDNGDNGNDNSPPPDPGLLATSQRSAFQSQCAQNVLECTTSWPEAVASIDTSRRQDGQAFVTIGNQIIITNSDGDGSELIPLQGDQSVIGDNATSLGFQWSHAATDGDRCTLEPGPVFSTEPNPIQRMEVGFHYIRLTVSNDNIRDIASPECGLIAAQARLFDFVEIEIEVRD